MAVCGFAQFMRQVDAEIEKRVGLSYSDLADYPYYDAYEDDVDPVEVARDVIEENM